MEIIQISNFFNHHQKFLSDCLYKLSGGHFCFFCTKQMSDERKKLGWGEIDIPSYVTDSVMPLEISVDENMVIIMGDYNISNVKKFLRKGNSVFIYSERLYKSKYEIWRYPFRLIRFWWKFSRYKSLYLLSASAYATRDFNMHGAFLNKAYKWGYFPECIHYDIDSLIDKKDKKKILWCGRFLDWKHPDVAVTIAERLITDGYDFDMDFIGSGELEESLKEIIREKRLEENVHFLNSIKPKKVREHMENAGIYLFTSDFGEGWGAVLNEAMNSGCAVVASHAIGSVPFLMQHRENGLIYKCGDIDDLYNQVKYLLDSPQEQVRLGENAYHTIVDLWNAEVAAERFMNLVEEIKKHGYCDLYKDGPCSKARIIKNDWFKG